MDAKIGLFFPQVVLLRWPAMARSAVLVDGCDNERLLILLASGAQTDGKSSCSWLKVGSADQGLSQG